MPGALRQDDPTEPQAELLPAVGAVSVTGGVVKRGMVPAGVPLGVPDRIPLEAPAGRLLSLI